MWRVHVRTRHVTARRPSHIIIAACRRLYYINNINKYNNNNINPSVKCNIMLTNCYRRHFTDLVFLAFILLQNLNLI